MLFSDNLAKLRFCEEVFCKLPLGRIEVDAKLIDNFVPCISGSRRNKLIKEGFLRSIRNLRAKEIHYLVSLSKERFHASSFSRAEMNAVLFHNSVTCSPTCCGMELIKESLLLVSSQFVKECFLNLYIFHYD